MSVGGGRRVDTRATAGPDPCVTTNNNERPGPPPTHELMALSVSLSLFLLRAATHNRPSSFVLLVIVVVAVAVAKQRLCVRGDALFLPPSCIVYVCTRTGRTSSKDISRGMTTKGTGGGRLSHQRQKKKRWVGSVLGGGHRRPLSVCLYAGDQKTQLVVAESTRRTFHDESDVCAVHECVCACACVCLPCVLACLRV